MPEQRARLAAVDRNLRLQEVERFEQPLVSQPLHEPNADGGTHVYWSVPLPAEPGTLADEPVEVAR